ncbi:uncharacterized protein ATC70_012365 [Mucor velutinosus]|uniref:Uncharacterized protein n=1 Tax=Mucor velutinosus TaxID=708070 RepID=A0AAN7D6J7_9FUNG|nr:hypothetical protein ATC70_012365 [Mucor velutinosus]
MTLSPTSQHHHPQTSIDIINISTDFGPTTPPSASPESEQQLSTFMIEVRNRLARLETAHVEIERLKTALAESEAARQALEAQLAAATGTATSLAPKPSSSRPPPATTTTTTASASVSTTCTNATSVTPSSPGNQLSFASVVASNVDAKRKKKPAARPPPPPSVSKASATLARLFAPQSDIPYGYQFIYFATPVRRSLSELRRLVQGVVLNNSRVLDIQYPVQNVISFLVHNDYVLTVTKAMHLHGRGCSPLIDFDPCDPINLKDPKLASLSPDLRVQKAIEVKSLRSLSFVRRFVRISVAHSFLLYDRINQAQFNAILKEEMLARSSSSAAAKPRSPSSDQERLAKKQRLSYLGYLLHHDAETASLLAYAVSPTLSATEDLEMSESSDN